MVGFGSIGLYVFLDFSVSVRGCSAKRECSGFGMTRFESDQKLGFNSTQALHSVIHRYCTFLLG